MLDIDIILESWFGNKEAVYRHVCFDNYSEINKFFFNFSEVTSEYFNTNLKKYFFFVFKVMIQSCFADTNPIRYFSGRGFFIAFFIKKILCCL